MKTRMVLLSLICGLFTLTSIAALTTPTEGSLPTAPLFSGAINDVVKLVRSKVPDSVVVAYIRNSSGPFQPSADELLRLRDLGISVDVMTAMLEHGGELRQQAPASAAAAPYTYSQRSYAPGAPTPMTESSAIYSDAETTTTATTPSVTYINTDYPVYTYPSSYSYSYYTPYYYPYFYYPFWPYYSYSCWPYNSYCYPSLYAYSSFCYYKWSDNHCSYNNNWNGNNGWHGGSGITATGPGAGASRMRIDRSAMNINRVPTTRANSASVNTASTPINRQVGTSFSRQMNPRTTSAQVSPINRTPTTTGTPFSRSINTRTTSTQINRQFNTPSTTRMPVNRTINRPTSTQFSRPTSGPSRTQISRPVNVPTRTQVSGPVGGSGRAQFSRPMSAPSGAQFSGGSMAPARFNGGGASMGPRTSGGSMGAGRSGGGFRGR